MSDINKAFLSGRAGCDPEIGELPTGVRVARFSVATGRRVYREDGTWDQETQRHDVAAWGRWAEAAEIAVAKGAPVVVEGRISCRRHVDASGAERQATEIVVAGREGSLAAFPPSGKVPPDLDDEIPY